MKRALPAVAALAAILLLPGTAVAKGPSAASVAGPGLDHAISIQGYGEGANSSPLGILVEQGGFFAQAFEQTPSSTSRRRMRRIVNRSSAFPTGQRRSSSECRIRSGVVMFAA